MKSEKSFNFTEKMETIFGEKMFGLKSFYCREDFELALKDLDEAAKDSYRFRLEDLRVLCAAREIDVEKLLADKNLLREIPARVEVMDELMQAFYEMYKEFPKATDYMERIVRRLASEYNADSVRVAILKKFLAGAGENFKKYKTETILKWAQAHCTEEELGAFVNLSGAQRREILINKVDEDIFADAKLDLTASDIFPLLVEWMRKCGENMESFSLGEETLVAFEKLVKEKQLPTDANSAYEKVLSIEKALEAGLISDVDSEEIFDEFVSSLEKNFLRQMKSVEYTNSKGKNASVVQGYKQKKKDAKKLVVSEWELVKLANDLACGNYRTNGKTKGYLYSFAIMFGMTLSLEGKAVDKERDIEKNLFQDYYNDNLLRFLEGDYVNPDLISGFEKEPTGEGINYKNFAEAIYLYFIWHHELEMTPGERIDAAENLIEKCVALAQKTAREETPEYSEYTKVYKEKHFNLLLNLEIKDIPAFIVKNYKVISPENKGAAHITVASEENTAFDTIGEILEDLGELFDDGMSFEEKRPNWKELKKIVTAEEYRERKDAYLARRQKWEEDILFRNDTSFRWELTEHFKKKYASDSDFMKVVEALESRLHRKGEDINKAKRKAILMVLRFLATEATELKPITGNKIKTLLEECFAWGTIQVSEAVAVLQEIGYDVKRKEVKRQKRKDVEAENSGEENTAVVYCLGEQEYADEVLNDLLKQVAGSYFTVDAKADEMLAELIERSFVFGRRVTRSELLAVHFNYYIMELENADEMGTFEELFEDYAAQVSPILEEARYQPLSEKNIIDMYIVTGLYYYFLENQGYMSV